MAGSLYCLSVYMKSLKLYTRQRPTLLYKTNREPFMAFPLHKDENAPR